MALVPTSMLSKINDSIAAALKRKLDANGVRNDATTTDAGYVLDARMGKTLGDRAEKLELKVGDLYFDTDSSGRWGYKSSKNGAVTPFRNPTGNAEAGDVLSGKTFSSAAEEDATGTMPNRGELNVTLKPDGNNATSQSVAAGYYSGGTIKADGTSSYSSGYTNGHNQGYTNGYNTVVVETVTGAGIGWSKTYPGTVLAAGITYANQIYYSWDNGDMGIRAWCSTSGNTVSVTADGDSGSGNNKLERANFNLVVAYRNA